MQEKFDVIILGSGIGGSSLSIILAKSGLRVLVIDSGVHPRFAIGESTTLHASQILSLLALEYDIPEFDQLGLCSPEGVRNSVGATCGIKRTVGFVYHELGAECDFRKAIQFGNIWRDENHFFRQDIDLFLVRIAEKYGAKVLQNTHVQSVNFLESEVVVSTSEGSFTADFLADGSGFRSVIADALNLREEPCRFRHESRSIFTHMVQIEPLENHVEQIHSIPWSESTLHHIFDGGWIWVIPFNNWPGSSNPLVSIGLTLDSQRYPENKNISPEAEFFHYLDQLPTVKKQFANAKAVRPWVRTGRLQYSSTKCVGPRYCLLSSATGFIDPLYSRGLVCTLEVNRALAKVLIEAFHERDYSFEKFAHLEDLQRAQLEFVDRLVHGSFVSWTNFELWNAWCRVWAIATGCLESNLGGYVEFFRIPQMRRLTVENPLFSPFEDSGFRSFFEKSERILNDFEQKKVDSKMASQTLFQTIGDYRFSMNLKNRSESHIWALKNPMCRDLLLGNEKLHARWSREQNDPGL